LLHHLPDKSGLKQFAQKLLDKTWFLRFNSMVTSIKLVRSRRLANSIGSKQIFQGVFVFASQGDYRIYADVWKQGDNYGIYASRSYATVAFHYEIVSNGSQSYFWEYVMDRHWCFNQTFTPLTQDFIDEIKQKVEEGEIELLGTDVSVDMYRFKTASGDLEVVYSLNEEGIKIHNATSLNIKVPKIDVKIVDLRWLESVPQEKFQVRHCTQK
jgi:hypothetical protein